MNILRIIIFFTALLSLSFSDSNNTSQTESSYIDDAHKTVSDKVITWSDAIDTKISGWFGEADSNATTKTQRKEDIRPPKKRVKSVDSFFQNKRYFDEAEETYLTLRLDSEFNSLESDDFKAKLSGQIALGKSKQRFKFFVDNATTDNVQDVLEDDASSSPELGFHYFVPEKYGIESKYSLGLRGIDPFVRARYFMPLKTDDWYIEPSQMFKYSVDDKFEEETTIYFDRHFDDLSLFRFVMHRATQEKKKGMDYDFTFQYYWSPMADMGLRINQSFIGNTKYPYIVDPAIEPPQTKTYGGIYDYITSFSFRQNIWRKWFFYEVRPGVNFHKDHDYEANYSIRLFFDLHFGNYR